jgi:hypothetical protein
VLVGHVLGVDESLVLDDLANLVGGDTNGTYDVFVRDTVATTTNRVSVRPIGTEANDLSGAPAISADGRFVAFFSVASNVLAGDANGQDDVFLRANPEPAVTGITPATLTQGTTTPVTVTGSHFLTGAQLVIDGGCVTLANVTVVSETPPMSPSPPMPRSAAATCSSSSPAPAPAPPSSPLASAATASP